MKRFLAILSLCVLGAGAATAGVTRESIRVGGEMRSYLLYTPDAAAPPGGRPMLLVLHGGGGAGREVMLATGRRFNALAETNGALILYPDAIGRVWDFGEGTISEALRERHDDFTFLTGLVRSVAVRNGGDPDRVYATGISRGGQAAWFLACKAPGLLAGIAPVSMSLPDFLKDDCSAAPRIPVLLMNGTADPIVPYGGGPIRLGRQDRGDVLSTDATMEMFRRKNGCSARTLTKKSGDVERIVWQRCKAGTVLYRVNGGGHSWPGGTHKVLERVVGPMNRDIKAPDEIWAFFFR